MFTIVKRKNIHIPKVIGKNSEKTMFCISAITSRRACWKRSSPDILGDLAFNRSTILLCSLKENKVTIWYSECEIDLNSYILNNITKIDWRLTRNRMLTHLTKRVCIVASPGISIALTSPANLWELESDTFRLGSKFSPSNFIFPDPSLRRNERILL